MIGAINFRAVQEHFGLSQVAPVEKDWHVLRAFQAIVRVDAAPFRLVFAGGTARPYNYNGVGYDRQPSEAVADVFVYDVARGAWREGVAPKDTATMDHRGLLEYKGDCYIVGGLDAQQAVTARITTFPLPETKQ